MVVRKNNATQSPLLSRTDSQFIIIIINHNFFVKGKAQVNLKERVYYATELIQFINFRLQERLIFVQ